MSVLAAFRRALPCALASVTLALGLAGSDGAGASPAGDAGIPLRLDAQTQRVELWTGVRVLEETTRALGAPEALARIDDFRSPATPWANLGPRQQAVWVSAELEVATDAPERWILDVNYPSIDRIDLFEIVGGAIVRETRLGDEMPFGARPFPGRTHAVELALAPGERTRLLMRVRTSSAMILPMALARPAEHQAGEARAEALQGLCAGIGLSLLIYSLAHWIALRDRIFFYYAVAAGGTSAFFLAYAGLAHEHLWPGSPWLTQNAAPTAVLVALWGGLLFLDRILRVEELSAAASRVMSALAWLALAAATAFALDFIDYRAAQLAGTILGPTPILLGLPVAWLRMRQGDRLMVYFLLGWALYAVGIVIMALLLRGYLPADRFTMHAFQFGSISEMALWLVLLGQRVEQIRRSAETSRHENDALRSLALTDALTGLPNRRGLGPIVEGALRRSRPNAIAAVFMLDLDGFKPVNDLHGHAVGDQLLAAVAARLRGTVRDADVVARLGGDEFVVVAEGFDGQAAAGAFGEELLAAFRDPFVLPAAQACRVGATIGYALSPQDGRDATKVLHLADQAMYEGKQHGKRCLLRYEPRPALAAA